MPLPLLPLLLAGGTASPTLFSIYNSLTKNGNTTSNLLNNIEIPTSDSEVVNIPRSNKTTKPITSTDTVPAEVRESIAPKMIVNTSNQVQPKVYVEEQPISTSEADALAIQNAKELAATQKMREMQASLGVPEEIPTGPGFYESATPNLKFVESPGFYESASPSLRFNNFDNEYERLSALAELVMKGKMGNGASRKKNLGADYAKVQKIVNSRLKGEKDPFYELMVANAMGGA